MNLDHIAIFYAAAGAVLFLGPFLGDVLNMEVARDRFARQLLGGVAWPLTLLWWARPSWLWREVEPSADVARLRLLREDDAAEMLRLRGHLAAADAELAKLRSEREGYR